MTLYFLLQFLSLVQEASACTALAVRTPKAAFASMNADCAGCDGRVANIPSRTMEVKAVEMEGSLSHEFVSRRTYTMSGFQPRFVGLDRGSFYFPEDDNEEDKNKTKLTPLVGTIQVPLQFTDKTSSSSKKIRTFSYWEAVLPWINEAGLTMGESSCGASIANWPDVGLTFDNVDPGLADKHLFPKGEKLRKLREKKAIGNLQSKVDVMNLMQIGMEFCKTAKCAVQTMGEVAEREGFYPSPGEFKDGEVKGTSKAGWSDAGETVTVADTNGDAWVFHVLGAVEGESDSDGNPWPKSVWVAKQVLESSILQIVTATVGPPRQTFFKIKKYCEFFH